MKLFILSLFIFITQGTAAVRSQTLSLHFKNAPLEKVLGEVKKQTGYSFITSGKLLKQARKVDVHLVNADLDDALSAIFKGQPLTYAINGKLINVKQKKKSESGINKIELTQFQDSETKDWVIEGIVINEDTNQPIEGVTVELEKLRLRTQSDSQGRFRLVIPKS